MLCKSVGRGDDGHAVISVSDTGIGIPDGALGGVFEWGFTVYKKEVTFGDSRMNAVAACWCRKKGSQLNDCPLNYAVPREQHQAYHLSR